MGNWQQWKDRPEVEGTLAKRARGELGEMESTLQLVDLVADVWEPGMRVLDVGCNAGHYLRGLRRISPELDYTGVDAYEHYIAQAREIYADDARAAFEVRDVHDPLFPDDPFEIVYCCNVILHLPDFRPPLESLLASTRRVCLVRTLVGPHTTKARRAMTSDLDEHGEPLEFVYQNTWARDTVEAHAAELGWATEFVEDRFDPNVLAREHQDLKNGSGTGIVGGRQVDGVVLFDWEWLRFTPRG